MKQFGVKINYNGKADLFTAENFKDLENDLLKYPKSRVQEYFLPASYTKKCPTFQRTMKLTIFIGQCFGLNPVLGILENDSSKLRFTFISGRCFYSILTIVGQSSFLLICITYLFRSSESLSPNASIVFIGTNCLATILFLRLAMRWPKLCQQISRVEAKNPNTDEFLVKKCNIACIVVLVLAALEHILSDISGMAIAIDCQPDTYLFRAFNLQSYPQIWYYLSYNDVYGSIVQFVNFQCTFNWNFSDVFVICLSIYLTSRFEQINKRLMVVKGKSVPLTFWRTMREDYSRAVSLVRRVDDVIGSIVFVSFANNLFFICLQLLHTLEEGIKATAACNSNLEDRPLRGYEQAVYFVFSFSFLVARSLSVSLVAAKIHTVSREPAQVLYEVPSSSYCVEVQRFLDQIHGDTVALSGLQFFNIKRGLVLTIATTIITYELVLMQFAGVSPASPSSTDAPVPTVSVINNSTL